MSQIRRKKTFTIITQARIGSTRFPDKLFQKVNGQTLLELHLTRLKMCKTVSNIMVATTHEPGVEKILNICESLDINYYQGSTSDVLSRYFEAAKSQAHPADYIIRVTSDCPLIDWSLIDQASAWMSEHDFDYLANNIKKNYPHGLDFEIFSFKALEKAKKNASDQQREHVTTYIRENLDLFEGNIFKGHSFHQDQNLYHIRITVDYPKDFLCIKQLVEKCGPMANWPEYAANYPGPQP